MSLVHPRRAPQGFSSLRVFIHCAPECIPKFMSNLAADLAPREGDNQTISEVLSDKISSQEIAKLLRDFPEAAASLLQKITAKPKVKSEGWHGLPSRVSFAPEGPFLRFLSQFVRVGGRFYTFYQDEREWSGSHLSGTTRSRKQRHRAHATETALDVELEVVSELWPQVCSIPNIISPNFFSAVLDASERPQPDALFLFKCVPIRAAVSYTFWNGAIWVDVVQFLVSVWGLGLLLVETFMAHEASEDSDMLEDNIARVFEPSFITERYKSGVVADWIIAKGIVDTLLEGAQFWGCVDIEEPWSYLRPGNLWDVIRSGLPILLLCFYDLPVLQTGIARRPSARMVQHLVWERCRHKVCAVGVTYSERIGHALLPLHKLASGLMPVRAPIHRRRL
eukprot:Skav235195  [mRNA]  locus=scaffold1938:215973:240588:- [translate_table: standard]